MVSVSPHCGHHGHTPGEGEGFGSDQSGSGMTAASTGSGPANRLNLLLSCASWRSDSWADRLPPLLEPMGVFSLRARSARQAEKVIRSVRVHIAVVDLGLPLDESASSPSQPARAASGTTEEAGPRILDLLARLEAPPPTVVIKGPRTARDDSRHLAAALRSGAFAVVDRTGADVEQMLEVLRRCLHRFYRGQWPGMGGGSDENTSGRGGGGGGGGGGPASRRRHWFSWSLL